MQYKFDELKINFNENDKLDIIKKKKYKAEMILFRIRERLLSKLLQIDEIEERAKAEKQMHKVYKNVTKGLDLKIRLKSAKPILHKKPLEKDTKIVLSKIGLN